MHECASGIYAIHCMPTNQYYIGSSVDMSKRWSGHQKKLRNGTHSNKPLQQAWNTHGAHSFMFEVLEFAQPHDIGTREQYWIDTKNSIGAGFNILIAASRKPKPNKQGTVTFGISISETDATLLDAHAEKLQISRSTVIRWAIRKFLSEQQS